MARAVGRGGDRHRARRRPVLDGNGSTLRGRAALRPRRENDPCHRARMGVETSCDRIVRAYTINNARITFEEELKGSIEPGKLADLVILSADYLTVPESEIQRLTALATMIGGKLVYIDPAARAELARCASATILIYDSSTDQYIYAWRTDKRVTTDHRCRRRERMPMQDSARPSTAPAVTIGRSACGSRNFSGRGSRRLGRQRQAFPRIPRRGPRRPSCRWACSRQRRHGTPPAGSTPGRRRTDGWIRSGRRPH